MTSLSLKSGYLGIEKTCFCLIDHLKQKHFAMTSFCLVDIRLLCLALGNGQGRAGNWLKEENWSSKENINVPPFFQHQTRCSAADTRRRRATAI